MKITKLNFLFIAQPLKLQEIEPAFEAAEIPRPRLLSHWLIHSCLYYELGQSIISDFEFDQLGEALRDHWEEASRGHPHAHLVAIDEIGNPITKSGYYLRYPSIVRSIAERIAKKELCSLFD